MADSSMFRPSLLCLLPLAYALVAGAAEVPGAVVILEVLAPSPPGQVATAAPPRFVLLSSGEFFVGGTSGVATGRLDKPEARALEQRLEQVRKLPGLGSTVSLGPGPARFRLQLRKGRALEILAAGDPATAPASLKALASLIQDLSAFDHPGLHPYEPASYALSAREGSLPGGCRPWAFGISLAQALAAPRSVPAAAALGWPTGAIAASVCADDKRYVVTLQPLLPGERP